MLQGFQMPGVCASRHRAEALHPAGSNGFHIRTIFTSAGLEADCASPSEQRTGRGGTWRLTAQRMALRRLGFRLSRSHRSKTRGLQSAADTAAFFFNARPPACGRIADMRCRAATGVAVHGSCLCCPVVQRVCEV